MKREFICMSSVTIIILFTVCVDVLDREAPYNTLSVNLTFK
jgi:hypothetical protein